MAARSLSVLVVALASAAAQSFEPSSFDSLIDCTASAVDGSSISVSQTAYNTATVTYNNFSPRPTKLWLTNSADTVIAQLDNPGGASTELA